jgi:hypothetical protein
MSPSTSGTIVGLFSDVYDFNFRGFPMPEDGVHWPSNLDRFFSEDPLRWPYSPVRGPVPPRHEVDRTWLRFVGVPHWSVRQLYVQANGHVEAGEPFAYVDQQGVRVARGLSPEALCTVVRETVGSDVVSLLLRRSNAPRTYSFRLASHDVSFVSYPTRHHCDGFRVCLLAVLRPPQCTLFVVLHDGPAVPPPGSLVLWSIETALVSVSARSDTRDSCNAAFWTAAHYRVFMRLVEIHTRQHGGLLSTVHIGRGMSLRLGPPPADTAATDDDDACVICNNGPASVPQNCNIGTHRVCAHARVARHRRVYNHCMLETWNRWTDGRLVGAGCPVCAKEPE